MVDSDTLPRPALDRQYVLSKLRRCALVERVAKEYYDKKCWPESDETNQAKPDRIPRKYRYRRLHREASVLDDEIARHIFPYAAHECWTFCEAMHHTLPRELRDIVYNFLYHKTQPVQRPYAYGVMPCHYIAPFMPDRDDARLGDVAFTVERTIHELALSWSCRNTIIVAEGWQRFSLAEYSLWNDGFDSKERTQYVILKATYPIAKCGQDFSRLASDLAVLSRFERPLKILIDWDTCAILHDKIRTVNTDMIEYFENIVELCPLLQSLLESRHSVSITFRNDKRPFVLDSADLVGNTLVSKAYVASYPATETRWGRNSWTSGSYVVLPRMLHGLC